MDEKSTDGQVKPGLAISGIPDREQLAIEARNRTFFEIVPDGILIADPQSRYLDANPGICRMLGYSHDELVGMQASDIVAPNEVEHIAPALDAIKSTPRYQREWTFQRKDGTFFDADVIATTLPDGNLLAMIRDITASKSRERELQRINQLYAALNHVNQAIVRSRTRGVLLLATCRALVEHGGFDMVWIGWHDPETRRLLPIAAWGDGDGYLDSIKVYTDDRPDGHGPSGTAFRTGQPCISNDMLNDPALLPWLPEIKRRDYRASASLPIRMQDEVCATLSVYSHEPGSFQDREIELLKETAGDISHALDNLMHEQSRRDAETTAQTEKLFSDTMTDSMPGIVYFYDETGRFLRWNRNFEQVSGYGSDEIKQMHPLDFFSEADKPLLRQRIDEVFEHGEAWVEAPFLAKDGSTTPYLFTGRRVTIQGAPFLAGVGIDISERKLAMTALQESTLKIERLNRVLAVLSQINALIVRVSDRQSLFEDACRIAVEAGGFRMAMVCMADRDSGKIVPVASAGKPEILMAEVRNLLASSETASDTLVASVMRGKVAHVTSDVRNDRKVLLSGLYVEHGVRSLAVLPLVIAGEATGVIALYASELDYFHVEEMKLLSDLAADIGYAIDHIEKQERLDHLAYYDALTGLANRTLFLERVAQYMRGNADDGNRLALFLFDLERFKNINDTLGRAAGDMLLQLIAQWMSQYAGNANLLARVDADHFAFVLPKVRQDGDLARALEQAMNRFLEHPFELEGHSLRVAAKAGVAFFPDDGDNTDTLFKHAETALKFAKVRGERHLFFDKSMIERVAVNLALENRLRQARRNDEFVLHYQPKVNLKNGKVVGAEALIRWNNPETGLVPPVQFIPVLEETGLIHDVGQWAVGKAIADYLHWRDSGLAGMRIAVNVSPLQLRNRGFVDEIRQLISVDPRAADGLELEITESMVMENVEHGIDTLRAIRALGVHITLDDFGTGFSSLSHLSRLPLDVLKVDRSFVHNMTTGPDGFSVVSNIITLAHSLKLNVVAEGVETQEQERLLRSLKCDEMQGFLFSKPVPIDVFEARFLAGTTDS